MTDISILVSQLKDQDWSVKRDTQDVITTLIRDNQQLASEVLNEMTRLLQDPNPHVRQEGLETLSKIVKQHKELATQAALNQVKPLLQDNIGYIKTAAMVVMNRFVEQNKELAPEVLYQLISQLKENNQYAIGQLLRELDELVRHNKELASEACNQLRLLLKANDQNVRDNAVQALEELIEYETSFPREAITLKVNPTSATVDVSELGNSNDNNDGPL